jgi:hypothetical protein
MSALHLLWIIPLSAMVGFFTCALLSANDREDIPMRCKECKFWADGVAGCTDHVKCCKVGYYMIGENGYCSFGERRDDHASL